MERLIVFGDPESSFSALLVEAVLRAAAGKPWCRVVCVCDAGRHRPPPLFARQTRRFLAASAMRLFNPDLRSALSRVDRDLYQVSRKWGVPVVVPPERNVNHPGFIDLLGRRLRPTAALSVGCLQIFEEGLLGALGRAANFHDGLLPAYRGLHASAWSVYRGEQASGFTVHLMERGVDTGPVLVEWSLPVLPREPTRALLRRKIDRAVAGMDPALELLFSDVSGTAQEGPGRYFGKTDYREITAIREPGTLTREEVMLRLRSFGRLVMLLAGKKYVVTGLSEPSGGPGALDFQTIDGHRLRPDRFLYLPRRLYLPLRWAWPGIDGTGLGD